MNTKQKKTLLGAIVALVLVGTIVVVGLALAGKFSSAAKDDEAIKSVLKAIEDALALKGTTGDKKLYLGGVYIKVEEQFLGDDKKPIATKESEVTDEQKKTIKRALQKVTVYGVKTEDNGKKEGDAADSDVANNLVDFFKAAKADTEAVVVDKGVVEFKDVADAVGFGEDYSVLKKVMDAYKVAGADGKFGVVDNQKDRVYYKRVEAKPTG